MNEISPLPSSQINSISELNDLPITGQKDFIEYDKTHECTHPGCDAAFSKPSKLTIHLRQHTGERPYKCDYEGCDKSYTNTSHLKRHYQTHDMVKQSFKCPKCSQMISNRQNLKRHYERAHAENSLFYCKECDMKFSKESKYKEHEATHKGVALYKCEICEKQFSTLRAYKKHEISHNGKKEYRCEAKDCTEVFEKWSLLCKHRNSKHTCEYKCKDCDKIFMNKTQLKSHSFVHTNDRSILPCPYEKCPRFYFFKRNLDHHIRANHLGKNFHCDICDMRLSTKQKIVEHMSKIHLAKKKKKKKKKKKTISESEERKRNDAGTAKKSMLSKLVGLSLPREIEKDILNRKTRIPFTNEDLVQNSEKIVKNCAEMEVVDLEMTKRCEKVTNDNVDDECPAKSDENQVVNGSSADLLQNSEQIVGNSAEMEVVDLEMTKGCKKVTSDNVDDEFVAKTDENQIVNRPSEDLVENSEKIIENSAELEVVDIELINGCKKVTNDNVDDEFVVEPDKNQVVNGSSDQVDEQRVENCDINLLNVVQ